MKKAISILILFVFLFSTSGFSINTHYCHGRIRAVNFGFSDNCKSCCGKKKCSKGCCKNKTEIVKIIDNYIPESAILNSSADIITLALSNIQTFNIAVSDNITVEPKLNYLYPPDKPISLSILYRSIVI